MQLSENKEILIIDSETEYVSNLKSLKEIKVVSKAPLYINVTDCPELRKIEVENKISRPIIVNNSGEPVTIKYHNGIRNLDEPVAGEGVHAIFGDSVEQIGIIKGGRITLGKSVREIRAVQTADKLKVECTVPEYELPTIIEFTSMVPPVIGTISPNSLSLTELRVPSKALEIYSNHPQWKRGAYIVDKDGNSIDNFYAKYQKRIEKKIEELEKQDVELEKQDVEKEEELENAKKEKIKDLSILLHKSLGQRYLSKWKIESLKEKCDNVECLIKINDLGFEIDVPLNSSPSIWDKIKLELEKIESKMISL